MPHKNDYTCIVFFESGSPKKWTYVHGLRGFANMLNEKHKGWKYFNVYDRRKGSYLKRFYSGNLVPYFLSIFLVFSLLTSQVPLNSTFNNGFFFNLQSKPSIRGISGTFNNGFNNTATIPTPSKTKGGQL